jgi:hypothetical protein
VTVSDSGHSFEIHMHRRSSSVRFINHEGVGGRRLRLEDSTHSCAIHIHRRLSSVESIIQPVIDPRVKDFISRGLGARRDMRSRCPGYKAMSAHLNY